MVSTWVGSQSNVNIDGWGQSAGMWKPFSLTIDTENNLFVFQSDGVIRKVSSSGIVMNCENFLFFTVVWFIGYVSTFAGSSSATASFADGTGTNAVFSSGFATIAADSSGNVYVADYSNMRLRVCSTAGILFFPVLVSELLVASYYGPQV